MTLAPHEFDWSIDPECSLGYSEAQLPEQLGETYPTFEKYMLMKAHPICTGRCPCAEAHGHAYYPQDVLRFVERSGPRRTN